jgi:L-alanine-DL-glutamate epimerase-like enolase superfamily enzyme
MRITDIREVAVPLKSTLRNAVFDFSEMTTSVVAVHTDQVRDGRPVVGYSFNSTGRYACGAQMRDRFIPRILKADPQSLLGGAPLEEDIRRVEAALELVGDSKRLAVDANAGFDRSRSLAYAKALGQYQLKWFEEPTDPLDYALLSEFSGTYGSAIGTGENLFSTQDIENLIRFGGLQSDRDFIQIDVPQSYGIVQFARTLDMMKSHGWSRSRVFPHGGNQMTLHIVGGFGLGGCEAYPGVFGAFAGFADDAKVEAGWLQLPDRPGIGFEAQDALYAIMKQMG